jgi:hypothetical protein
LGISRWTKRNEARKSGNDDTVCGRERVRKKVETREKREEIKVGDQEKSGW